MAEHSHYPSLPTYTPSAPPMLDTSSFSGQPPVAEHSSRPSYPHTYSSPSSSYPSSYPQNYSSPYPMPDTSSFSGQPPVAEHSSRPSYSHTYTSPSSSYPSSYPQNYSSPYPSSQPQSYPSPYSWGGEGGGYYGFPPGTSPEIIQSFQAVDQDRSGSIDEKELQAALSSDSHKFSIRTVRLLMFLFKNPSSPSKMGPAEFASLWGCIGQWRSIFDRFDRDRSGKIDSEELREVLRSLGYAVPPSVIQVLISNYTDGKSSRGALDFDYFVECLMIVKGLTEKFKEKDTRCTGSAAFTYDTFMSVVIPFIVP